ncbi:MAG TPA: CsbD family protein [Gaiellaceae bacterium]|nr:CsbD family protein [Gaiellaceae bacterium]
MANWDQAEGELKEQGGRLTGDEELEREGEAQGAWGDVKDTADDAKDKAGDAFDDAKDKL